MLTCGNWWLPSCIAFTSAVHPCPTSTHSVPLSGAKFDDGFDSVKLDNCPRLCLLFNLCGCGPWPCKRHHEAAVLPRLCMYMSRTESKLFLRKKLARSHTLIRSSESGITEFASDRLGTVGRGPNLRFPGLAKSPQSPRFAHVPYFISSSLALLVACLASHLELVRLSLCAGVLPTVGRRSSSA